MPVVLSGQYDQSGNLATLSATINGTNDFLNSYVYDDAGEMKQVSQTGNGGDTVAPKTINLTYNGDGQFSTIDRYLGSSEAVFSQYGYTGLGQLQSLTYAQTPTSTLLAGYSWSYDLQNEVTQETSVDGTTTYAYDPTGQLTGASSTNSLLNESYSYDANGNRTNGDYTTTTGNEMATGAGYSYQYDNDGNRIAQWVDNNGVQESSPQEGDTNITIYTWDYRDRMTSVTTYASYDAWKGIGEDSSPMPTQTVTYTYDIFNRWLGETVTDGSGTVTENRKFVYDGNEIVLQFDSTAAGDLAAANLSHRYLYGPAVDQVLADEQVSSLSQAGNVVWPLADNLGTVRDLAVYNSQTGATSIANHRVYNAFGVLESQTNAAVDCVFGYAGGAYDSATGEENFDNRWYEAVTGQWLSEDPIASTTNLYSYCGDRPTSRTDPSGMDWLNSYANFFNGIFGSGYSRVTGNVVYGATVGSGAISNNTLANASANTLAGATAVVAIPAGVGLLYGGEVALGVGTFGAAAGTAATVGVGSTAVVAPGLGAGSYPALLINGTVYVARFHSVAFGMAGGVATGKYGMVVIDCSGKVLSAVWAK